MIPCKNRIMAKGPSQPPDSAGFLIAQVGAYAAMRFAEALKPHGFTPHDAGILRLLSVSPGLSQQQMAQRLRIYASRLVGVLDDLQQRGWIERRPSAVDRRFYELYLTKEGEAALQTISQVARKHHADLFSSLTEQERSTLAAMLRRVAEQQGLTAGVHPGYSQEEKPHRS
ncbi:MAG TPA: MarR family transcriptional regulator [Edaphobacter sp.]|jgi:DNA-binding MarR family transcriptional regulator